MNNPPYLKVFLFWDQWCLFIHEKCQAPIPLLKWYRCLAPFYEKLAAAGSSVLADPFGLSSKIGLDAGFVIREIPTNDMVEMIIAIAPVSSAGT